MIGVVTGLQAEARLARELGRTVAGGGTAEGARRAAEALVAEGVTALVSFGLAGGLDPALAPGAVVVPEAVVCQGRRYGADGALSDWLGGVTHVLLAGEASVVATQAGKEALFARSGAVAVDIESGPVADVAARHGLPFAVLRAVCDPAGRDLPPAALVALDAQGAIAVVRVAASLLRRPGQMAGLIAVGRDAARARRALVQRICVMRSQPPPVL